MFLIYPDTKDDFQDKIVMDQFINAQLDLESQIKISKRRPENLNLSSNQPLARKMGAGCHDLCKC